MDSNACMQRLLDAIDDNDREECEEATLALVRWLEAGGFAPTFTSAMAGVTTRGEPRLYVRLKDAAIMTTSHLGDGQGWMFVSYDYVGNERWRVQLEGGK